ncbi:MAG: hypothetical protein NTW32_11040 [Chloroflexi bacterium]|nr:hypothetical protein [Chloroflexota bacterium]
MFPSRKLKFGLIYGLAGGLIFALAAWGVNAFLLYRAQFAYPWLALLIGILPALLIGGLAGYLTIFLDNALLGGLSWLIAGILLAVIGIWLPLWLVPELLPRLEPALQNWVDFFWRDSYTFLVFSAAIVTGVAFLIAGLLETVLIDQTSFSPYNGAIIMPILVCAFITGIAGGVIDNMVNTRFRDSAIALDQLFVFALENADKTIEPALARQMHMGAISTIRPNITAYRRLFYFTFTETADQGRILVDFKGHWALCDVFLSQVAFCQPVEPPQ